MAVVTDSQSWSVKSVSGYPKSRVVAVVTDRKSRQSVNTKKVKRLCYLTGKGFLESSHMVFTS